MNNNTIYIFRHYASEPNTPGSTRHYSIARELVKKGFNVYIFSSNFRHFTKTKRLDFAGSYTLEEIDGINYVWINTYQYTKNNWKRLVNITDYGLKAYNISKELHSKGVTPNIVIGSVAHIFAIAAAYEVSKKYGSKFFMDIGDMWPEAFIESGKISPHNPLAILTKKVMTYYYGKADKILTLSDQMNSYFNQMGYKTKTVLMPPGILIDKTIAEYSESNYSEQFFKVVYAGSLTSLHASYELVKAAKILQDGGFDRVKFIIIGGGTDKDNCIRMSQQLRISNIEFLEPISKAKLLDFIKCASAFVLTEKKISYGFPNKLIDYLKVGRPIVYASPANHSIANYKCCIKADSSDPVSIAEAVIRAYQLTENELNEIQREAKQYLIENHNIKTITQRLIKVI